MNEERNFARQQTEEAANYDNYKQMQIGPRNSEPLASTDDGPIRDDFKMEM